FMAEVVAAAEENDGVAPPEGDRSLIADAADNGSTAVRLRARLLALEQGFLPRDLPGVIITEGGPVAGLLHALAGTPGETAFLREGSYAARVARLVARMRPQIEATLAGRPDAVYPDWFLDAVRSVMPPRDVSCAGQTQLFGEE